MEEPDHYRILEVSPSATQAEIKQAYRRLAKLLHPDRNRSINSHEKIAKVNAAYEVLGDSQNRKSYDQLRTYQTELEAAGFSRSWHSAKNERQQRTAAAQAYYRKQQKTGQQADTELDQWLKSVYTPVNRLIREILDPLKDEINDLSADPFDDELMRDFQLYLEDCQDWLMQAEKKFRSLPNPASVAGVAEHLFYCLNRVEDGIEQLEFFTANYDEDYLHTGQELFRIAKGLLREAQASLRAVV
jgi:molecular chaperone DnaJ